MHDTLYGLFVDPYKMLKRAGLKKKMDVLEVGCGPGFFSIPAARVIGPESNLYAIDLNPVAVEKVEEKLHDAGLENARVMLADATDTGFDRDSVDLVFLFGVIHAINRVDLMVHEMHRVLRPDGVIAVQAGRWPEEKIHGALTQDRLFQFSGKSKNVIRFVVSGKG